MYFHRFNFRRIAFWLTVLAFVILAQPITSAFATPAALPGGQTTALFPLDFRTDPVLLVASYYNAINLQDYGRAYGYWENPPKGAALEQFAAGYADTTRAAAFVKLPAFVGGAAGSIYAGVPVLLVADRTDGSQHFYSGCFTARRSNVPVGNATEPDPNWRLNSASLREVPTFDLTLLDNACEQRMSLASAPQNLTSPVSLLAAYYEAIVNRDYARAYGYWENPPKPTVQQFAQGFANTRDIAIVLRLDVFAEGAAGSTYASLPTLVMATLNDGTRQYFTGCFTARHVNVPQGNEGTIDPDWGLYDSNLLERDSIVGGMSLLDGACSV